MKKYLLAIFCVHITFFVFAQTITPKIDQVNHEKKQTVYYDKSKTSAKFKRVAILKDNINNKVASSALSLTMSSTPGSCYFSQDGTASVSVTGGTPPYNYFWSNGATTANVTGLDAEYEYNVIVVDADCNYDTDSVILALSNNVYFSGYSVGFFAPFYCGPGVCVSSIVFDTVFVENGSGNYSYNWSPGGYTTLNISNVCAGSYSLTITDNVSGCSNVNYISDGYFVFDIDTSFNTPVSPSLSIVSNTVCNDTVYFLPDYFSYNGYDDTTCYPRSQWHWDFGDGASSTIEKPYHVYPAPGAYTVTLIVNQNDTVNAIIKIGQVSFDTYFNSCNTISFYYNSCPNTLLWNFGDPSSGTSDTITTINPSHEYLSSGTYSVTLIVNMTDTITQLITIDTVAVSSIDVSIYGCNNDTMPVYFYPYVNCASAWGWNFGDPASGILNTDTMESTSHVFSSPGTYTVTLIIGNGVDNDTLVEVVDIPALIPYAINLGNDTVILVGDSLILNAGVSGQVYSWYSEYATINNSDQQSITVKKTGLYQLSINDSLYCHYSSDEVLIIICGGPLSSVDEITGMQAAVFPNPFTGSSTLQLNKYFPGSVFVMYDVLGKEVMRLPINNIQETIVAENCMPGIYFYKILTQDGNAVDGKLVIQ